MGKSSHDSTLDLGNRHILVDINGSHIPRDEASVSVFDSGFVLGDGVWQGLHMEWGTILFLEDHLQGLFEDMKSLDIQPDFDPQRLTVRLYRLMRHLRQYRERVADYTVRARYPEGRE